MGLDVHAAINFMIAAARADMKNEEYVYILPWLSHVSSINTFVHFPHLNLVLKMQNERLVLNFLRSDKFLKQI